jgi:predicted NBD/HSP70 family sugar kinase
MYGSTRAALRYYRELRPKSHVATFQELLNLAEEGDAAAAQALTMQAQGIGRGLRMIIAGLSPSTILIAGDVTSAWHRFGPVIEKEVAAAVLVGKPPRVRPAADPSMSRLSGTVALVLKQSFGWATNEIAQEAKQNAEQKENAPNAQGNGYGQDQTGRLRPGASGRHRDSGSLRGYSTRI